MFEKKKTAFSDKTVFGYNFKATIDECFCKVSKMLFMNKINTDGTIDESKADICKKSELWSYIYYLYHYNSSDIDEFKAMKVKDKANAVAFYNMVRSIIDQHEFDLVTSINKKPITVLNLIKFINYVIVNYSELEKDKDLVNPIIDYLKVMMTKQHIPPHMPSIKFVTGDKNSKFVVGDEANIKIKLYKE